MWGVFKNVTIFNVNMGFVSHLGDTVKSQSFVAWLPAVAPTHVWKKLFLCVFNANLYEMLIFNPYVSGVKKAVTRSNGINDHKRTHGRCDAREV